MSTGTQGIVTNGIVVPSSPLPEGASVEIRLSSTQSEAPTGLSATELRLMPRVQRQAALAAAAALAEEDYESDEKLTGFEAASPTDMASKGDHDFDPADASCRCTSSKSASERSTRFEVSVGIS